MKCPDCGNAVTDKDHFCPKCFAIIKPPSLWQRFLAIFRPRKGSSEVKVMGVKKVATVIAEQIVTNRGGERQVYQSLTDLPPDRRAEIERLKADALSAKGRQVFKVRDSSGQERTYHSLEELPPEIRGLLERARSTDNPK